MLVLQLDLTTAVISPTVDCCGELPQVDELKVRYPGHLLVTQRLLWWTRSLEFSLCACHESERMWIECGARNPNNVEQDPLCLQSVAPRCSFFADVTDNIGFKYSSCIICGRFYFQTQTDHNFRRQIPLATTCIDKTLLPALKSRGCHRQPT